MARAGTGARIKAPEGGQRLRWLIGLVVLALTLQFGGAALAQDGASTPEVSPNAPQIAPGEFTQERPYLVAEDPNTLEIQPLLTSGEAVDDYQMAGTPDGLGAYVDGDDVVVFMNHEWRQGEDNNLTDARVSLLTLDPSTAAVTSGDYVIDGSEGYRSFCSAFLAGPDVGFDQPVFLTGEENTEGEHGGISLAVDRDGTVTELPWLGHIRHENQVVVPGFADKTVVITTDDDSEGAELYMFVADSPKDVLDGNGQLYVFVADDADGTADIAKGDELSGRFEPVDEADNEDAAALQNAVDDAGAFNFVRLEDVTYDRTNTTTIYFADTGDNQDPNLATPTGEPLTANGRLYTLTLDPDDPTHVTGFGVLLDGDAGDDIRNPDNIDANESTIMIQEDLNDYNREADSDNTGRILAYDIASGELTTVARIDQSDDPDRLVDPDDEAGSWESSGIIDVSDIFGAGTWLVDVQAHTRTVEQFNGEDEGGQLLLIRQLGTAATPEAATPAAAVTAAPTIEVTESPATAEPTVAATEATEEPTEVPAATTEPTATTEPEPVETPASPATS